VSLEFCDEDVQFRVYVAAEKPIVYMDSLNNDEFVPCATVKAGVNWATNKL
jgi:hypothetical protein